MDAEKIKDLNYVVKDLFNAITDEDVLRVDKQGVMYIGDNRIPSEVRNSLIEGAKAILAHEAWDILTKQMQLAANKRMYEESTSVDDMIFGKAMLYTIDVMQRKLYNLSNLNPEL